MTPIKLKSIFAAGLLSSVGLTACNTPGTQATVEASRSDACLWLTPISYSTPPRDENGNMLPVANDAGNVLDTPETTNEIEINNARLTTICPALVRPAGEPD